MRRLFLVAFLLLTLSQLPAKAMEVVDPVNLVQNMQTALESAQQTQQLLQQYQTQLMQYQNMLTNTLNPSSWGFGQLQNTLSGFQSLANNLQSQFTQLSNLQSQFNLDSLLTNASSSSSGAGVNWSAVSGSSNLSEALTRYGQENVSHYSSAEMSALGRGLEDASINNVVALVEEQQDSLDDFSTRLQTLTSRAQSAQGQQEAIQIQTQILTMMIELQAQTLALMQASEQRAAVEEKKKIEEEKRAEKLFRDVMCTFPTRTVDEEPLKFPGD